MCPHCALMGFLAFFAGLPIVGYSFGRAKMWLKERKAIHNHDEII